MSERKTAATGKNKGGRPRKSLTDEQVVQVEALGAVLSLEQIADYFGVGKPTFYAIMERQPEVSLRYKKGKARAIESVAQGLLGQALGGNLSASIFYLKTQAGWRETQTVDHKSTDGSMTPRPAIDVSKLSTAALRELVNAATGPDTK